MRAERARLALAAAAVAGMLLLLAWWLPAGAIAALWTGSVGSWDSLTSGTLVRATPLVLTGLATAVSFRAGVFNIGAEGQFLAGAAAAAALGVTIGPRLGHGAPLLELAAGAAAGGAWASIAAVLRSRFRVLEVISTILLNFLAAFGVSYLVRGPLQEQLRIYPQSETLDAAARLPLLLPASRLHAGVLLAAAAAVVAWWVLRYTAAGFRLRAVGANPFAASSAGLIDVRRTATRAFLISGALAGLGGAVELTGVTYALYENISPGYGYTAIAVALLARLHPLGVLGTAFLFGGLEAGAAAMQRDANVPSVLASIVEAVVILFVLAGAGVRILDRWRAATPAPEPERTVS
jgi:ABC-type uncharacterized transport system permease subunit